ncbi:hypothetical protein SAMN05421748_10629 [Paractinoplanes atraurantiacus]|uniref:Uncharacterized protein n=1 Tax=Paractinoplanes atraurantiacus TaxID=1036182 RepID=A0A285HXC3_9ACTN|nr:hypothetical protein SAMN05421748_10629 [Actinoplanes atraurantiacus]
MRKVRRSRFWNTAAATLFSAMAFLLTGSAFACSGAQ